MPQYDGPIVDEQNPFYCPSIPADSYHQFLKEARQMLNTERPPDHDIFHSYQRALEKSLSKSDDGGSVCKMDWIRDDPMPPDCAWPSSQPAPGSDELPPYSSVELTRAPAKPRHNTALDSEAAKSLLQLRERQPDFKKKLSDSFSDFEAPPQYARSMVSFHNSSFEFEVSRKGLNFFTASSSPTARVDAYLHSTMDNIGHLIDQLDRALPGIRLAERLRCQPRATPQSIMDFLVENEYVNGRTLDIMSGTNVERILMESSEFERNGLNLCYQGFYSVFCKPNAFRDLAHLSFSGTALNNSDIMHIHHLPSLSVLLLNETGIGNEAVFLLVSLKQTLTQLSLATNPSIDNDAVPAIILLYKLSFLTILDTGIDMAGLRRLAGVIYEDNRVVDIEIPFACEVYVDSIHSRYLLNPRPPLITDPSVCGTLSLVALKRNLEAHAACNPSIVASGTHAEMVERLSEILATRKLDNLVVSMLEGDDPVNQKYGLAV